MDKELDGALVWFRRDLRVDDQAALYHALRAARQVWCAFVFDTDVLRDLPRQDRRVEFIHACVRELDEALRDLGARHGRAQVGLLVRHGRAQEEIPRLAQALHVQAVYANHDYEPAARERDARVRGRLADLGIVLHTSKDQVIFEADEVRSATGTPYVVYTPYRTAWLRKLDDFHVRAYPVERYAAALAPVPERWRGPPPTLESLGFEHTNLHELKLPTGMHGAEELLADFLERMDRYRETRDFPALKGPSYLSAHLRFGTVSIRRLARLAWERAQAGSTGAQTWLSQLVWRDFYFQVLYHHPHVVGQAFRPQYDRVRWEHGKHAEQLYAAWCEGRTGYPIVDAAMRQLNQTGYMHNRLRMVAASFLTKHLGVDWRWGERYFAEKLNDHDLAANNGGWQWAASTGTDPQPYFRIFNPVSQSRRFDAEGRFIRRYLPELARLPDDAIHAPWLARPVELQAAGLVLGKDYPEPIVAHDEARARALQRYAAARALPSGAPRRRPR
ncbi:MAG TPA: deoxyribodipyrimidine photo-lyase [Burkholderiaceae bacterium]|nr:deoxyribodipyrimidine photo-lyase [Burkholderiaceae bacterium]